MGRRLLMTTMILGLAAGAAASAGEAGAPCCRITAIDARTGVMTVQDKTTARTFQCRVTDAARIKHLRVGQAVKENYFSGRFLSAEDFTKEQEYHRGTAKAGPRRLPDCPAEMTQDTPMPVTRPIR